MLRDCLAQLINSSLPTFIIGLGSIKYLCWSYTTNHSVQFLLDVDRVLSQRPGEPQPAGQPLLPAEDGGPLPLPPLLPLAIRRSLQVKMTSYGFMVSSAINCLKLPLAVPRVLLWRGVHFWANILWLTYTFAYLFGFPGEYYKVTILIYWIEVLPFVGLKDGNFQRI